MSHNKTPQARVSSIAELLVAAALLTQTLAAHAQSKANGSATAAAVTAKAENTGRQPGGYYGTQPAVENIDLAMYERIRAEGLSHGVD